MAKQKTPASEQLSQAEAKRLNSRLQQTPIAVVGMASVFADAKNLSQYWDNIMEKIDSIIDVPPSRWAIEDYYSPDKSMPDKTYCKRGAFIPDLDFDPMEFGLPPNILEVTDIAQLLALVVARDVIEDAGIGDGSGYDRDKVGVVLGVGGGLKQIVPLTSRLQYPVLEKVLTSCGVEEKDRAVIIDKFKKAYIPWEENSFPGMLGNVIAGRIANRFDLGGTNCVVDAACAGSLAAMKLAVSDLLEYRSEVMISGGICCDNSPFMYMSFSKTPAFTTNETIRPFDEDSKGMMVGEGIGMVALKRLEDAERDGDRVYAVLKGIGTSSDGRFKSIYAPRPDGQAKALKRAWDDAGVDPKTCGLIEAHGTGTMAGDAAEFAGLSRFFGQHNDQHQSIALGSVKSQIGHTKSAAGSAGFIKVCLALHHKVLPPTINVDKPGSQLDIDNSPFYLNTETRPWLPRQDGAPRRGGVSSFGFGGTNFHFVLEEYQPRQQGAYRLNIVPQAVLLAGDNEHAVLSHLQAWRTRLAVDVDEQPYVFNRLVTECGLQTPAASQARIGFVARDAGEALAMIDQAIARLGQQAGAEAWTLPSGIAYRRQGVDAKGKVVALFSGQGSQYVNMGVELACNFPPMLAAAAAMDAEFSASGLDRLSSITYPTPVFSAADREAQDRKLQLTQHAQPAIGTFSAGVYDIFRNAGFVADFAAGHSFGELTALWAAGVLSDKDFRMLARARGQAMAARDEAGFDAGTMIAVVGEPDAVARAIDGIDGVSIANYNSRNQVVVAGATAQVEKAFELLKADFKVVKLPVSAAFHTPLVGHAQKPFAAAIDKAAFAKPAIPVFANGTGKAHSDKPADIKKALKNHILESVRFNEEVANLYQAGGRVFVEFGPKNVLTRLVENILSDKDDVLAIAVNANPKKSSDLQLRQAAVQMAVYGVELANVDPYSLLARPTEAPKKSPMAMKLSAASYVSDKTRKAFDDALNDGYRIAGQGQPQVVEKIVEKVVEKIVEVPVASAPAASAAGNAGQTAELVATLERSVSDLCRQQQQLLDVHEQVMQGPQQYARTVEQVLSAQAGGALPDAVDKTLAMYHQFQSDTLRVHEQYLNRHAGQGMSPVAAPVTAAAQPVPVPVAQPAPVAAPVPPAAAQTAPVVATPASKPAAAAATKPAAAVVAPAPVAKVAAAVAAPAGLDSARVQQVMMAVVAEKTGYPAEMLELSMDMEADLGIDSIKRVEILGAVQDQLPGLPELNPEDLAELRTPGQIVDYMQAKLPQGS
ncbi:MAG TPA: beta-ketoacyl synthase N-terminal-like domain-containing protein, partial [Pseudomonadales bacterium]